MSIRLIPTMRQRYRPFSGSYERYGERPGHSFFAWERAPRSDWEEADTTGFGSGGFSGAPQAPSVPDVEEPGLGDYAVPILGAVGMKFAGDAGAAAGEASRNGAGFWEGMGQGATDTANSYYDAVTNLPDRIGTLFDYGSAEPGTATSTGLFGGSGTGGFSPTSVQAPMSMSAPAEFSPLAATTPAPVSAPGSAVDGTVAGTGGNVVSGSGTGSSSGWISGDAPGAAEGGFMSNLKYGGLQAGLYSGAMTLGIGLLSGQKPSAAIRNAAYTGVGAAVGNAFLPGLGGVIGGVLGGALCFAKGTKIAMLDGTTKNVEELDIGDQVLLGGNVLGVGRALSEELYEYRYERMTGSHAVFENGRWIRCRDSEKAVRVPTPTPALIYPIITEHGLLATERLISADVMEVPNSQDYNDVQRLALLNSNTDRNQLLLEAERELQHRAVHS